MDVISYNEAATANSRIESFIENPDSKSGLVSLPKKIDAGESVTIPDGRVVVHPNLEIDGTLTIEDGGELFVPFGGTLVSSDLVHPVDTIADLRNVTGKYKYVYVTGYHTKNDGAFGSHIFRLKGVKTTETDNGGTVIIATIGGTDYVYELEYDGAINVKWFGAKGNGITDDTSAIQSAIDTATIIAYRNKKLYLPSGRYAVSDTVEFPHDLEVYGDGAKNSIFYPHTSFPFGEGKFIVADKLNSGSPDNNFFCIRRDFGVVNKSESGRVGCYWAKAGGGSRYSNLYLADAYEENTLMVSGEPYSSPTGAPVGATFNNIWLANTSPAIGTGNSNSKAKNGLFMESCYGITFNSLIVDYQSNTIDYGVDDLDGFGVKLRNSVGCVFNGIIMEGNAKPFYSRDSYDNVINGGVIYRKGLGSAPSDDPDFVFTLETSDLNMPTVVNLSCRQGYDESYGGGKARIRLGGVVTVANRGGAFSYFNSNANMKNPNIKDATFKGNTTNFTSKDNYYDTSLGSLYRPINRLLYREPISSGTSGTANIPLLGIGSMIIILRRDDITQAGYGQIVQGLVTSYADAGVFKEIGRTSYSVNYDKINTIAWSDTTNGIDISYSAVMANSVLEVYFIGSTRTDILQ